MAAAKVEVDLHDPAYTTDLRPRVFDYNARTWLLLDSGAAVSCYPVSAFPDALDKPDPSKVLQAVNGQAVPTYGSKQIKIDLGGRTYVHTFILARISEAICGWDLMLKFKLDLVWGSGDSKKCYLLDKGAKKSYPLHLQKARRDNVNLALVT